MLMCLSANQRKKSNDDKEVLDETQEGTVQVKRGEFLMGYSLPALLYLLVIRVFLEIPLCIILETTELL
jgi:hypothetical protein